MSVSFDGIGPDGTAFWASVRDGLGAGTLKAPAGTLHNITAAGARGWLQELGAGERNLTAVNVGAARPERSALAALCADLAAHAPSLNVRYDNTGCMDGGAIAISIRATTFNTSSSSYCGGDKGTEFATVDGAILRYLENAQSLIAK